MDGALNSGEFHCLTVAPGSHNAEVEGSGSSLGWGSLTYLD
jgi:hypothetical protein